MVLAIKKVAKLEARAGKILYCWVWKSRICCSGDLLKDYPLTITVLWGNSADNRLIFFLFFLENKIWHFMQIVSLGDNLHEVSDLIFLEKYFKMSSAEIFIPQPPQTQFSEGWGGGWWDWGINHSHSRHYCQASCGIAPDKAILSMKKYWYFSHFSKKNYASVRHF